MQVSHPFSSHVTCHVELAPGTMEKDWCRIRETHHEIDQKQALLRSFAWPDIVSVGLYEP
jgi:hypothetical protein